MRNSKLAMHQKLVWYISVLILIQAAVFTAFFFKDSHTRAVASTRRSLLDLVVNNSMLVDDVLTATLQKIKSLNVDSDLFDTLEDVQATGYSYGATYVVNGLNNRYFWDMSDSIVSVNLVSSSYSSAYANFILSYDKLAEHIPDVTSLKPEFLWYPNEVLEDWGHYVNMSVLGRRRTNVFLLVRKLNPSIVRMGSILLLDREIERPTLVVSFKPEIYDKAFRIDQGAKPYSFLVATPDGKYVAGNESAEGLEDAPWLADARKSKIGSGVYSVHGGDSVVCYATSLVNGWILAAFVPIRTLTAESVSYMTIVWLLIAVNALIIITVMYFASRRVTKPYYDLAFWADNVSMGNLADVGDNADNNTRSRAAVRSGTVGVGDGIGTKTDDVSRTISRFNSWLDDMVQRNSEIASREQDAIISALEMQLNPHFLFNTLNIINLIAMEEGQDEISTMIVTLSGMMQHTIHLRGKFSKCAAEIEFLDKYVYLMTMRFADKFTLRYDVSPEALDAVVPKMLLQPFVENSILHGLADVESGGEIVIRAFTDEQMIVFQIEDNGAGLPPESLHTMLYGSEDHIGCSNVNQRIQLIFGKDYGISVTSMRAPTIVQLRFPYIKAN